MHQRTVHRFAAVLALSAALALAGARPAAAQEDFGVFERGMRWLAALLDMPPARQMPESQALPSSPSKSGTLDPSQKVLPDGKGLGVDPNGAP